jgi:hypothetical protein
MFNFISVQFLYVVGLYNLSQFYLFIVVYPILFYFLFHIFYFSFLFYFSISLHITMFIAYIYTFCSWGRKICSHII